MIQIILNLKTQQFTDRCWLQWFPNVCPSVLCPLTYFLINMFNHPNNTETNNVLQMFENTEKEKWKQECVSYFFSVVLLFETCKEISGLICC